MKLYLYSLLFICGFSLLNGMEDPDREIFEKIEHLILNTSSECSPIRPIIQCKLLTMLKPALKRIGFERIHLPIHEGTGVLLGKPSEILIEAQGSSENGPIWQVSSWKPRDADHGIAYSSSDNFHATHANVIKFCSVVAQLKAGDELILPEEGMGMAIVQCVAKEPWARFYVRFYKLSTSLSYDQFRLLEAIGVAIEDTVLLRERGIKNQRARIHADRLMLKTFKSLPEEMQKGFSCYIVSDDALEDSHSCCTQ